MVRSIFIMKLNARSMECVFGFAMTKIYWFCQN